MSCQRIKHEGIVGIRRMRKLDFHCLLRGLGGGWLAGHGCPAAAELDEAMAAVNAYQDSPGRAELLATLARLRAQR